MKIDISRDTFRPVNQFARVLMLQGRVQLDADWNEQIAILWDYLRTLTVDLVGTSWGPGDAFLVSYDPADHATDHAHRYFRAAPGHYYVHGMLAHNSEERPLTVRIKFTENRHVLIWLRVSERLVTAVEDDYIREVALGGPDTAARTRIVPQLLHHHAPPKVNGDTALYYRVDPERFGRLLHGHPAAARGTLKARVRPAGDTASHPCVIPADARYRGLENQLYRVEIYHEGTAGSEGATFLWSRDNGSVLARWVETDGWSVTVQGIGREGLSGFAPGQWVQLLDDDHDGTDHGGVAKDLLLARIQTVHRNTLTLHPTGSGIPKRDPKKHPKVRRWDSPGLVPIPLSNGYTELEEGIEVQFEEGKTYSVGDYWLIPARTGLAGGVEWPTDEHGNPRPLPPHSPVSYEVPLALVEFQAAGDRPVLIDLRKGPHGPINPEPPPTPKVPDSLKASGSVLFRLFASGVRTYVVKTPASGAPAWALETARAELFDEQGRNVGIFHEDNTSLIWRTHDSSQVSADAAALKSAPAPDPAGDADWFLVPAKNPSAFGIFASVTSIQQLFTVGGQAPPGSPTSGDQSRQEPFLATFYFYK